MARTLLAIYPHSPHRYDEMLSADGGVRPHWQAFFNHLDAVAPDEMFVALAAHLTESDAAALGATIDELIVVPEDQAEQTQRLETVLAHGTLTFETIRRCRDGTLIYVDVSARCIATGNDERGISLLWIEKDVTALRVRRDGRLLSARYHDLLESTPDGIVLADRTGHVVIANSHAEHLFGYAPGELDGQPVEMLIVVGGDDRVGQRRHAQRSGIELPQTLDGLAGGTARIAVLARQLVQEHGDAGIDQMRGDLRPHHTRAQHGGGADVEPMLLDSHVTFPVVQRRPHGHPCAPPTGITTRTCTAATGCPPSCRSCRATSSWWSWRSPPCD